MIWALLAMYFLGGGGVGGSMLTPSSVKQMSKQVGLVIEDPARVDAIEDQFDALRGEIKAFDKTFAKSGKAMAKLYRDHDSGSTELLAALEELNTEFDEAQGRALDARFEITALVSETEWSQIVVNE